MRNVLAIVLCAILTPAALADFLENFDDINALPGWAEQNNSEPLGTTGWFQGNTTVFPPQATSGYIAANYNNAGSGTGPATISNWLITPEVTLQNGDTVEFYTRSPDASIFPDRLQVRMSVAGSMPMLAAPPRPSATSRSSCLTLTPLTKSVATPRRGSNTRSR